MDCLTVNLTRIAGCLFFVCLLSFTDPVNSITKPEFMLQSSELPIQQHKMDKDGLSGEKLVAGAYPQHFYYPLSQQHQPVALDMPPAIPSQHPPKSANQKGHSPPLFLSVANPQSIPSHHDSTPNFSSGMRLDLGGALLIISDEGSHDRCPYQGFHSVGPMYESAYLVCIPGENNMFIGIEASCPKGQLFSGILKRCVGEDEVGKEKRVIRMMEAIGEMRERDLVPYVMGRVNEGENEEIEIFEEPVTFKRITDLHDGLGQSEKNLEQTVELEGAEMEEFVERLFVGAEQERHEEHMFSGNEQLFKLAELLEVAEMEKFKERADKFDGEEVTGKIWDKNVQTLMELKEPEQLEIEETEASFVELEDVALEVPKESYFDELDLDEMTASGFNDDVLIQDLNADVKEKKKFKVDMVSELLKAEDWVMVDNLHLN